MCVIESLPVITHIVSLVYINTGVMFNTVTVTQINLTLLFYITPRVSVNYTPHDKNGNKGKQIV